MFISNGPSFQVYLNCVESLYLFSAILDRQCTILVITYWHDIQIDWLWLPLGSKGTLTGYFGAPQSATILDEMHLLNFEFSIIIVPAVYGQVYDMDISLAPNDCESDMPNSWVQLNLWKYTRETSMENLFTERIFF